MNSRPRRNRKSEAIRAMVRESHVSPDNLIFPLFMVDGNTPRQSIESLPGIFRLNEEDILREVDECLNLGLSHFVLFPSVDEELKDNTASYSISEQNFYLRIIRRIKSEFPEVVLMSDVALDPYNSDGHDGIVRDGKILNDETLPILAKMSQMQAEAGIDIIGPSDMMDGRVGAIRNALDEVGYDEVSIMSYTAKYASAYYGPFRDALESAPKAGDKKTYQMDPANRREAVREAILDEEEGADYLMVKPALCYLDVIHELREISTLPIAAYNVSGEYAMLKAACQNGWLDYNSAMPEMLLSIRRAGADAILTYFAKDFSEWYANS